MTYVGSYDAIANIYITDPAYQKIYSRLTSPVEGNVNVYAGPGNNYVLTGKISEDDIDKYVKEEGDWIEVEYGKRRGYVQESELSKFNKSNLPYVSNSFVSAPTFRPTIVYFDGYTRQLTDNVSVYSGPSNSYSFQDTVAKDTTVTILHESTNSNSALDKLNPILLIEYNTSNGLKRGYAYKNDVLDLDNPLRGFDHVKKNNAAFSYNGKIYYSTAAYSHALDGWNKIYSDSDSDFQFDFISAVTGVISSNSGSPSLQQEVWLYDAKADANVSVVPGESGAKSMAILDLIMMAEDFVASGSDVFSIQFDLETCDNEGRLLIRTGSPLESPYAGKENVVLSTLLMSQYPGNAREKADEMIRDICPEITGSEKCDLRMNFSDDFDIDSFGYSLIIDKNGKVYAQTIIHPGTEFKIYQGNKYIGDLAIRLSNSLVELDDSTAERVFKILANNGIIRQ